MLLGAPPASAPTQRMMAAIWLGTIFDDGAPAGRYQFRIELTNEDGTVKVCESDAFDVEPGSATRQREPLKARVAGSRPDKPCA